MSEANVSVTIDPAVAQKAGGLLERMGLSLDTAIELFFRQIITERRLPFQPTAEPLSDENLAKLIMSKLPSVTVEVDENGQIILDKDEHPELYDWVVNG